MTTDDVRLEHKTAVRLPIPTENTLLLMIAAGFFILHILAAVYLLPRSTSADAAPPPGASGAMFDWRVARRADQRSVIRHFRPHCGV